MSESPTPERGNPGAFKAAVAGVMHRPKRPADSGHPAFWWAHFVKTVGVPAAALFYLMRIHENKLNDIVAGMATQAAAVAVLVGQQKENTAALLTQHGEKDNALVGQIMRLVDVILDRGNLKILPVRPTTTTIYVQQAPPPGTPSVTVEPPPVAVPPKPKAQPEPTRSSKW